MQENYNSEETQVFLSSCTAGYCFEKFPLFPVSPARCTSEPLFCLTFREWPNEDGLSPMPAQITRAPRGRPRKGATTSSSTGKKRKPPSSSYPSSSASPSERVQPSEASAEAAAATAATAAAQKTKSYQERFRKAEYKAGRRLVSKMSKKDTARWGCVGMVYCSYTTLQIGTYGADGC